jgi:hypothetical protein
MDSIGRIFAPSLGGVLLSTAGGWGTGFASASLYLVLLLLTQSPLFTQETPLRRPPTNVSDRVDRIDVNFVDGDHIEVEEDGDRDDE